MSSRRKRGIPPLNNQTETKPGTTFASRKPLALLIFHPLWFLRHAIARSLERIIILVVQLLFEQ